MEDLNLLKNGTDVLFLTIGAVMVLSMHAGFAFLEVGTVRSKNQVNALTKILADIALAVFAYFFIGYYLAYGITFFKPVPELNIGSGYELVKFFFLLTFAAAIPAIVSGGVAERIKFKAHLTASVLLAGLLYPIFEGIAWNGNFGFQAFLENTFGYAFHDFAGSVVVHGVGGFIGLAAIMILGPRMGKYGKNGKVNFIPVSNIPFLALGSWILCIGWFGFNVMSAQAVEGVSGLVAMNSLFAMAAGIVVALIVGKNDPGFIHNGALAGLVAICAGSDVVHPISAMVIGGIAGFLFVKFFILCQNTWKIDDVLGVWPLHGICGAFGGIATGIFGSELLGGAGGVSFFSQTIGTLTGVLIAFCGGYLIYIVLNKTMGIRVTEEEEFNGLDISVHKIHAYPESQVKANGNF